MNRLAQEWELKSNKTIWDITILSTKATKNLIYYYIARQLYKKTKAFLNKLRKELNNKTV